MQESSMKKIQSKHQKQWWERRLTTSQWLLFSPPRSKVDTYATWSRTWDPFLSRNDSKKTPRIFNISALAFRHSHTSGSGKARDTCPRHAESPVTATESGVDQQLQKWKRERVQLWVTITCIKRQNQHIWPSVDPDFTKFYFSTKYWEIPGWYDCTKLWWGIVMCQEECCTEGVSFWL